MIHIDGLGLMLGIMTLAAVMACIIETMTTTQSTAPWQLRIVHVCTVYCLAIFAISIAYLMASFVADGSDLEGQLIDGRLRHAAGAIAMVIGMLVVRKSAKGWALKQSAVDR